MIWRRHWIWSSADNEGQIIWSHYSDKTETVLGADFSLVLVDVEPQSGDFRYRMVIVQAKKIKTLNGRRVDVKRKSFSISKNNPLPEKWRIKADENLSVALKGKVDATVRAEEPNWQFTRLKSLEKRLKDKEVISPSIIYVVWPATPTRDNLIYNPVLFEKLDKVSEEMSAMWNTLGCNTQSFELNDKKLFRDYLFGDEIESMERKELISALQIVKADCAATVLINSSGKALDNDLVQIFETAPQTEYQPYQSNNAPRPSQS